MAGDHSCGERIDWLQSAASTIAGGPYEESFACSKVASEEFPSECGKCDRSRCNNADDITATPPTKSPAVTPTKSPVGNNNNVPSSQKCGGAVNSSTDSETVCRRDLWDPTGDSFMHCFAYGGSGDPCHLSNNNDPSDGVFKDPSLCNNGDTFYLWDEPDTQGRSYFWAGKIWLEYSRMFPSQLQELRGRGTRITSPLLKAGGSGVIQGNLEEFFDACGSPCRDPSDQAYIDVIAVNAFCGDFNGPSGCRGGASFIFNEASVASNAFGNLPVYITNWSRLQTSNPQDQVEAINAIEEFFPTSTAIVNPVVERVYWFGANDFGGGSSNNFLTQVLADGSTLGELWRNKCDSL